MSMVEMVQHHGYPVMHYFVTTEDGYILDIYRILGPKSEPLT
jgi:hypothetical protein